MAYQKLESLLCSGARRSVSLRAFNSLLNGKNLTLIHDQRLLRHVDLYGQIVTWPSSWFQISPGLKGYRCGPQRFFVGD